MSTWILWLLILFPVCVCQRRPQCPRWGQVKLPDPNTNRRFLHCNDGRGKWCNCYEGYVFVERYQHCLPQRRSSSSRSSSRSNSRREINSNSNSGRSMSRQTVDAQNPEIGPSITGPDGSFEENRARPTIDDMYSSRNHPYQDYLRNGS